MTNQALARTLGRARFPPHGWVGLALIATFWPLNWLLPGLRTHWGFFPLWLGYCLTVDGLNLYRTGTSLLTRSRRGYAGLFLVSAPVWWLFEAVNWRTQNWQYLGRELFADIEYGLLASLSFSTVVPAVLGTAELAASFGPIRRIRRGPVIKPTPRLLARFLVTGAIMLILMIAWPRIFFPFSWLFVYFLIEPVNVWLGNRSLFEATSRGDWRPVIALFLGVLTCRFFWEMWNFYSYPKWKYDVPIFGFWHLFEMPLLGYLGYLPFALELFAMVHLVWGLSGRGRTDYIVDGLFPES